MPLIKKRKNEYDVVPYPKRRKSTAKNMYSRQTGQYSYYKQIRTAPAPKRIELKRSTQLTADLGDSSGTVHPLNLLAQGSGETQRIGNTVHYHSLDVSFDHSTTNGANPTGCSYMLIYDRQTNQSLPSISAIMNSAAPSSLMNADNDHRFKVLWRKHYSWHNNTTATQAVSNGSTHYLSPTFAIPLRSLKGVMTGTGQDITDCLTGALYLVTLCEVNNLNSYNFQTRLYFYDA